MASRVVTGFTKYIDQVNLQPRKQILAATMDDVLNDQQFALEVEQVVLSEGQDQDSQR